ncbi:hypothetical protein V496_03517 [Pseudogymnoascus sp. VKM F-4515 (FW-2607)]|nr:hypothetical protein V496_03517 [Pseudogymnoascus sp. VKM F-4515 (FW-2607)]
MVTDFYVIAPEIASLALLCYAPMTYVLASTSTTTSVASLLVNVLATSGPYYFLEQRPFVIQPPRRHMNQIFGWDTWWMRWLWSAAAAVFYSLVVHYAVAKWALRLLRTYFPLAKHAFRESDLNRQWLIWSIPFISIALWTFFGMSTSAIQNALSKDLHDRRSRSHGFRLKELHIYNLFKRLAVVILLLAALTLVQLQPSERHEAFQGAF